MKNQQTTLHVHDVAAIKSSLAHFPTGVVAVAGSVADEPSVMVVSTFTVGISLEPLLASFAVQVGSTTWPRLAQAGRLGVSVLERSQGELCRQLAAKDRSQRLAGVEYEQDSAGAIYIAEASMYFECSIFNQVGAGDHELVLARIHDVRTHSYLSPLIYHRSAFRELAPDITGPEL